jgi:hypothetical protein
MAMLSQVPAFGGQGPFTMVIDIRAAFGQHRSTTGVIVRPVSG